MSESNKPVLIKAALVRRNDVVVIPLSKYRGAILLVDTIMAPGQFTGSIHTGRRFEVTDAVFQVPPESDLLAVPGLKPN